MGSAQWICRCSLLSIYTSRWRMSEHRQRRLIKNGKKTRTLWWRADFLMSISSFSMFCLVFSPPTLFFPSKIPVVSLLPPTSCCCSFTHCYLPFTSFIPLWAATLCLSFLYVYSASTYLLTSCCSSSFFSLSALFFSSFPGFITDHCSLFFPFSSVVLNVYCCSRCRVKFSTVAWCPRALRSRTKNGRSVIQLHQRSVVVVVVSSSLL